MKYLIFFILFSGQLFGAQVAKVILMRGDVSHVDVNGLKKKLSKGDWIEEGSEVITQTKSFAKLLFKDKSSINIGPGSNMKIASYKKDKAGIISLIKGQIRSKVEKDLLEDQGDNKSKMFIKTKNAAMGVRGTDFIVGFNPISGNTNLDVITGIVAMVNIKDITAFIKPEELDRALNSAQAVFVEKGMRTFVKLATPPPPPKEIPKTEFESLQKDINSFLPQPELDQSDQQEETKDDQQTKQETQETQETKEEQTFRDPIPPGVSEETFISDSELLLEGSEEIERLPTSTIVEQDDPITFEEVFIDETAFEELISETVEEIEQEAEENAEEITELIQNPNNYTRLKIIFNNDETGP